MCKRLKPKGFFMRQLRQTMGMLLIIAFFVCCVQTDPQAAQATPTEAVSQSPAPTEPPIPTETPSPTPEPTAEQVFIETPAPTEVPTAIPTETPLPSAEPAPTPFSIVWMSDTQNLTRHYPEVFNSMRDWILNEQEAQNIVFMIHSGDVVDACTNAMWDNASIALIPVLYKIPGMIVSGNHDLGTKDPYAMFFNRPYAKMVQPEGQKYRDGESAYQTFTAGGDEFLVFGLGYGVRGPAEIDWIESVIEQHPDAVILFVMHYGLQPENRYSGQARELYENIVKKTPNAKLLLCGHYQGALRHEDVIDDDEDGNPDRTFYTLMFNVQDDAEQGLGFMRIMTFYPEDRRIEFRTYSPWLDKWEYPNVLPEDNTFTLENAY